MIENFYIVNKSGGLIYSLKDETIDSRAMILASSLHSLTEIARVSLENCSYSQYIAYKTKIIGTFRTLTGLTFIFITAPENKNKLEDIFRNIYKYYSTFILSDPFYTLEMPIRSSEFKPDKFFK